jgi:hypothetical protein
MGCGIVPVLSVPFSSSAKRPVIYFLALGKRGEDAGPIKFDNPYISFHRSSGFLSLPRRPWFYFIPSLLRPVINESVAGTFRPGYGNYYPLAPRPS